MMIRMIRGCKSRDEAMRDFKDSTNGMPDSIYDT